jgi:hypothetical protein
LTETGAWPRWRIPGRFCAGLSPLGRAGAAVRWQGPPRPGVPRRCAAAMAILALVAGACVAVQVVALRPVSAVSSRATLIAAGNAHACMIQAGRAYCWGSNSNGQLGNGSSISSSVPVAVTTSGAVGQDPDADRDGLRPNVCAGQHGRRVLLGS